MIVFVYVQTDRYALAYNERWHPLQLCHIIVCVALVCTALCAYPEALASARHHPPPRFGGISHGRLPSFKIFYFFIFGLVSCFNNRSLCFAPCCYDSFVLFVGCSVCLVSVNSRQWCFWLFSCPLLRFHSLSLVVYHSGKKNGL